MRRSMLVIAMIGIVSMALNYEFLFSVEHNIGVRAFFWSEVWDGLVATSGFGVESIPQYYVFGGNSPAFNSAIYEDFRMIGAHNALFQYALKLGLLGVFFFIYLLFGLAKNSSDALSDLQMRLHTLGFGILLISCSVNTAIDSLNFVLGTAFLMSRLLYLWPPRSILCPRQAKRSVL